MQYNLKLLGNPALLTQGGWTSPPQNRAFFLHCYLSYQSQWVSREEILLLFWPDMRESKARQNLRTLLYKLKQEAFAESLEITETQLRWLATTDVQAFQEALTQGDWNAAVQTYGGPFLERAHDDSSTFEDWLFQTRDELHTAWQDAALHVAQNHLTEERYSEAVDLLESILSYDFLAEEVVQVCMKAQMLAGQKTAALKTFATFKKQLRDELEMEPLEETMKLFEEMNTLSLNVPIITQETKPEIKTYKNNLPQTLTPFVGRMLEQLELANLLGEPETQLITLLGPGGIGKSRLSLRLLEDQEEKFSGGVVFVALAPLSSATDIPSATASALNLQLSGESEVFEEVLQYLENRQMLLVFDNFEHVLGGVALVLQLLEKAPHCKVIVTSRVLLNLPNERVYDVVGLSIPSSRNDTAIEAYDAAQFFLRSARRVRSDFILNEQDKAALFELCFELQGMPLALELAATWVRVFSLPELVQEIRQDVQLLETTGHEVSERHKSIRMVFEHSWNLLSQEEQRVLTGLSVFHGGFDRQAAQVVMGATPRTLLSLVNKSLVRTSGSGRFFMLEVIRQCAYTKLEKNEELSETHAKYFFDYLLEKGRRVDGGHSKESLLALEVNLENIRVAWRWALQTENFALCLGVLESLSIFLMAKARLQEGIAFYKQALEQLHSKSEPRFLANLQLELAYFFRRLDQYQEANSYAEAALNTIQTLPDMQELTIKIFCEFADIQARLGNFSESLGYSLQALALTEQVQNLDLIARSKMLLEMVKTYLGNFEEAQHLYQQVLTYQRQSGKHLAMLRSLSDLGQLLIDINKPLEAQPLFQEGLELAESQHVPYEVAFMWEGLGQCSYLLGDYRKAQEQIERALANAEMVNDIIGIAIQCTILAKIHLALNQHDWAERYLKRALEISWDKQAIPKVLRVLLVWSRWFISQDVLKPAITLLVEVVEHPGAKFIDKQEAGALLNDLAITQLTPRQSLQKLVSDLLNSP